MSRQAAIFFCRLGVWLYLALRLYQAKSWLYRWIFERKYRKIEIPIYVSLDELVKFVRTLIWTADTWKAGFDAFSYPGRVQWVGTEGDQRVGDCDEFALYIATAVRKAHAAGTMPEYLNARVLTVTWMTKDGELGGHNVCLLETLAGYAYMDYDYPKPFTTVTDTVKGVLDAYGDKGATCLGWAITDPETLAPLEVHWN